MAAPTKSNAGEVVAGQCKKAKDILASGLVFSIPLTTTKLGVAATKPSLGFPHPDPLSKTAKDSASATAYSAWDEQYFDEGTDSNGFIKGGECGEPLWHLGYQLGWQLVYLSLAYA
jgi:hypothetical protein